MADDAKKSSEQDATQKGQAENKPVTESPKVTTSDETPATEAEPSEKSSDESNADTPETTTESDDKQPTEGEVVTSEDDTDDKKSKTNVEISIELPDDSTNEKAKPTAEFQTEVREQIENCKFEIIASIQENLHDELKDFVNKQIRKVERRRRASAIAHNIIILLLAALVGYFGYCLYDAQYFDFMRPDCTNNCNEDQVSNSDSNITPVKDTAWYQTNYGYLFDSLQINLNADKVSAYYLYSDDYKVSEIQPSYLLAMAYNRLNSNITYDSDKGIMIPANDLRTSFINLFGSAEYFVKRNFTYDCTEFTYDRDSDSFITPSVQCNSSSNRQILEEIDEIYEEGNAMYFLTTATIYDKTANSFYTFDNLFKPAVKNVTREDLTKHKSVLNQYQYTFKKVNNNYYFSDVIKLN